MPRNPVTVKLRHTGRVYVGMDIKHFFALRSALLVAGTAQNVFHTTNPQHVEPLRNLGLAVERFVADVKSKSSPSVTSVTSC